MKVGHFPVKASENEIVIWSGKCVTNSTSNPDGLSKNISSVTRTAAGKFTVVLRDKFVQCLWMAQPTVVGAAGYKAYLTSIDTDSNGSTSGLKFEIHNENAGTRAQATGTLTCDTKANSTARDYFILDDGQNKAMVSYNVSGTDAAKYAKLPVKATATLTCDTKANTGNEDYFTVWDGHRNWKIMLDTDGSGDSTGTADIVVDISGDTSATDVATSVHDMIMETTSVPAEAAEAIHLTSTDNADGTLTLTCDFAGYDGNGTNSENASNAWAVTNATGGKDAYPAEEFSHVDISGATTAADVAALVHTAINALTEVKITSTDNTDGTLTLANDEYGPHGNTSQIISETGATLMALTDMTGGVDQYSAAADTNNYDVYFSAIMRNSKRTFR